MTAAPISQANSSAAGTAPVANRFMPLLIFLFIGSGCAALIYEIVWFQILSLNLGSSSISLGVLLGTFMGGMCIGSLYLPRYVSRSEHPLRIYAKIEIGIALLGLAVLFIYPFLGGVYTKIGGPGMFGIAIRAVIAAICLLPPTILMGATLPAIARWVESTPKGVSWLGFFYGGNIAGAVLGSLLAGFYLLRVHNVQVATFAAFSINIAIAIVAFGLAKRTAHTPPVAEVEPTRVIYIPPGAWPVYVTIMLSGMTALASEVVWVRLLALGLGGTTYTFSLILAGFLIGLGLGSTTGAALARNVANPRTALGICQLLVMAGIAWAAYALLVSLPNWPIDLTWSVAPRFNFQMDMVRCLFVVTLGAFFWGASFPLALAAAAGGKQDPGRLVGTVYAFNTVGAIVGSLFASLIGIAQFGTQDTQRFLIVVSAASALLVLAFVVSGETGKLQLTPKGGTWMVATIAMAAFLVSTIPAVPPILIAYGRFAVTYIGSHGEFLYSAEGMNSSMAVSRLPTGELNYHNAGKIQASSLPQDMSLQRMLAHLTTLLADSPDTVLVIGCGAGVTAGGVAINPDVKQVTIAEIEPLVPFFVSKYFGEHNYNVVDRPNVKVQIDDGRHFMLTHKGKWDAITSDPFDPWVKGAASLYTEEFWKQARSRLTPGGVITVFVQLYEAGMPAVKSEIATFFEAFPNGVVFGNTYGGRGYDVVLVGFNEDRPIDVDKVQAKLEDPRYAVVAQSLREIGIFSATDLFAKFAARGSQLDQWLADAQINKDRNLRLQYLAGLGVNVHEEELIYSQILSHRQFPQELFTGIPATMEELRMKMMSQ
jgi:spermidine synthase